MRDRKSSSWLLWVTVAILVAPVLYVLSAGPTTWLDEKGFLDRNGLVRNALRQFYYPLTWTYSNGPDWWYSFLDWYLSLWGR